MPIHTDPITNSRLGKYRAKYKNWLSVARSVRNGKVPIHAQLREGGETTFHSTITAYLVALGYDACDRIEGDCVAVIFEYHGRELSLCIKGQSWGDIPGVFFQEDYRFLAGPHNVVIDIGANIGDSSVYFALNGAHQILAIEPFPVAFGLIAQNARRNGFGGVIRPVNAAIGAADGFVSVNPHLTGIGQIAGQHSGDIEIPVLSLGSLVDRFRVADGVLKMDCEGAEYEALLSSSDSVLRSFKRMQIEFHHGFESIDRRLVRAGFLTSHSQPSLSRNADSRVLMESGFIFATRPD
jgi:FkbM family methyltransferase